MSNTIKSYSTIPSEGCSKVRPKHQLARGERFGNNRKSEARAKRDRSQLERTRAKRVDYES